MDGPAPCTTVNHMAGSVMFNNTQCISSKLFFSDNNFQLILNINNVQVHFTTSASMSLCACARPVQDYYY